MDKRFVQSIFEAVAHKHPSREAIHAPGERVEYDELNLRANRLAHLLPELGVVPSAFVAVFLPDSIASVVSMLSIWKSGAVYLPLGVDLPDHRLESILASAKPVVIVTNSEWAERLQSRLADTQSPPPQLLLIDGAEAAVRIDSTGVSHPVELNAMPGENPPTSGDGNESCYLLFTSGSTGEPKGILGRHKSLSHFIHWEMKEFGLDETERVSLLAPPTFDVSLRDMLVPLLSGGTLCIPPGELKRSPRDLLEWLREERITTIHMVPSLFRLLEKEARETAKGEGSLPSLKRILLAGEPLYGADVNRWRETFGQTVELVNLYGPSESTLAKLFLRIGAETQPPEQIIPLGQPISNTAVLILKNGSLCRIGEEGELHIKTPFLSNGYFANPTANAEHFVQNPLTPENEDILFRTGDLGRYLPDRSIAFAGRIDYQVKIHGNRVEPGEIESQLASAEGVGQVVVLPEEAKDHSWTLTAFYTAANHLEGETLAAFLADRLPPYMIPGRFHHLEVLPLTAHGKVDRVQLAQLARELTRESNFQPPTTEMETRVVEIWAEVIGVEWVSAKARFFEIGGHSLHAIRIVSRLQRALGLELTIRDFFAHPVLCDLAAYLESLSGKNVTAIQSVPDSEEGYPLSPAQRRLWTLFQIDPDSVAYTIQHVVRLEGVLDLEALHTAWQRIVERHESLRTRFYLRGEEPRQRVDSIPFDLPLVDLSGSAHPERAASEAIHREFVRPFDLTKGPLLRVSVLRLNEREHLLLLNIHHIICDAWSLDVIAGEMQELYNRIRRGESTPLTPLTMQYRDYAVFANEQLETAEYQASRAFWLNKLGGEVMPVELQTDRPRPPVRSFRGSAINFPLPVQAAQALQTLAEELEVSPFVVMLGALKVLIYRLTGQGDVVVGTTIANRTLAQLEDQVGFYVNMLALRSQIGESQTFSELLRQLRKTTSEAYQHQHFPFDRLVEELDLPRDVSRNPLFDVGLIHHADRQQTMTLDGLVATPQPIKVESAKYDLLLSFQDRDGGVTLEANYDSDLYDAATIKRYLHCLATLLEDGASKPGSTVTALSLVDEAEGKRVREMGQGEKRPEFLGHTIVGLFEAQVEQTPQAIALRSGEAEWSYRELDEQAKGIVHRLQHELKVNKGDIVAVRCNRSAWGIFALLGILKAGAVYLPIDPDLPAERVSFLLRDSGCTLLLTDGESDIDLPEGVRKFDLRETKPGSQQQAEGTVSPSDLAYIIYTSGTTGQPKGVMVEHGSFSNMIRSLIEFWGGRQGEHILQFASVAFDASLSEIFMALLSGATLVLTTQDTIADPDRFITQLEKERITIITLPPIYLTALGKRRLPTLRTLISAGEAAVEPLMRFRAETATCWNAYGPSECSVCATFQRFEPSSTIEGKVPIGRPIANVECLVLDSWGNLLPAGVPGELWLAGAGLAKGYVGNPEPQREAFQPHLSGDEGERMYRTGDRACWLPDGSLLYLGRVDEQVKIRGHRIEPAEVAQRLAQHPSVAEAVAGTMGEGSERELVAWVRTADRLELWPSVAEFYIYDDILYRAMFTDEERNDRYRAAFRAALPGKTVLEIGPGPEAILSRLAIEAGAKKVYAVELLAETWRKAKARVAELGLEDRIEIFHSDLLRVELPEKVDACISEIVGAIGGSEGSARLINHARRFLHDPAKMIPSRSLTHIAAVSLPVDDDLLQLPEIAAHYIERIFAETGTPFDLRLSVKNFPAGNILSDRGPFEDLDYTSQMPLEQEHDVLLTIQRDGLFHGFLVWLELFTDPDHSIDILEHPGSWLPVFFPLSLEGFEVHEGDEVRCRVIRTLCTNGLNPDFRIEGSVVRAGVEVERFVYDASHISSGFRATPFYKKVFDEDGAVRSIPETTAAGLRRFLQSRLPDYMIPTRFIPVDAIPQTTNGKVDFAALRKLGVPQDETVSRRLPRNAREEAIAQALTQVTGAVQPGIDEDLFAHGLDSIRAIQLVVRLKEAGLHLDVRDIFQHPTIERLAEVARATGRTIDQGPVSGEVIPGPIQRWFFATHHAARHHFNQSVLLASDGRLDSKALSKMIAALVQHHDALRLRVKSDGELPQLEIGDTTGDCLREVDLRNETDPVAALSREAARFQAELDLEKGPLFRAVHFLLPEGDRLLLIAHHLVVDGVSWRILLEDLENGYHQAQQGSSVTLPAKSDSILHWGMALEQAAQKGQFEGERDFWEKVEAEEVPVLPSDKSDGRLATRADSGLLHKSLDSAVTQALLTHALLRYNTEVNDLLLTALVRSLEGWNGARKVRIALEGHGREELFDGVDVTRTVGWFTSLYPVLLDIGNLEEMGQQIRQVKETLRLVPSRGVGYGVQRWMNPPVDAPPIRPEISFNYLGQTGIGGSDGVFRFAQEECGPEIAPESELEAEIAFVCAVVGGELQIDIRYNRTRFTEETLTRLGNAYVDELRQIVEHCTASSDRELTPSDLSYDGFTMEQLDDFLDELDGGGLG